MSCMRSRSGTCSRSAELGEISPVPGTDSTVLGVRNLRGRVLPVFDLALLFGVSGDGVPSKLVVAEDRGRQAGLAIDEVTDVAELPETAAETESQFLSGSTLEDGEARPGVMRCEARVFRRARRASDAMMRRPRRVSRAVPLAGGEDGRSSTTWSTSAAFALRRSRAQAPGAGRPSKRSSATRTRSRAAPRMLRPRGDADPQSLAHAVEDDAFDSPRETRRVSGRPAQDTLLRSIDAMRLQLTWRRRRRRSMLFAELEERRPRASTVASPCHPEAPATGIRGETPALRPARSDPGSRREDRPPAGSRRRVRPPSPPARARAR